MRILYVSSLLIVFGTLPTVFSQTGNAAYEAAIQKWRLEREAKLKADDGWLTVVGLFWLKEGENSVGSGSANDIVLPPPAPERVGSFLFRNGKVVFFAERGANVRANGRPVESLAMRPDTEGPPDLVAVGSLTMHVIQRGDRQGIRLKDKNSKFRREFTGLHWFAVNDAYRVTARFVPHGKPKQIPVPTIIGQTEQRISPGSVVFTLDGQECRLDPVLEDGKLFFIFRDLTSGKETYPAARYLYADAPREGKMILDFNKAYSPPCAFTPYATCPLPPRQNHLKVRIPAGERAVKPH